MLAGLAVASSMHARLCWLTQQCFVATEVQERVANTLQVPVAAVNTPDSLTLFTACSMSDVCCNTMHCSQQEGDESMIALYTAQVTPAVRRREVYGKFLRSVTNTQVRRICLELANTYFPDDVKAILRYCL
jgi:Nuclear pore protein 84 / 107